ncbi:hypothetical protein AVEN_118268-1 [Araneus ventricosus]|uniref:Jerky-like n=1 Tax=Araneus ventricosus TaxID=182803 RepID=A0A4Y2E1I8_ARAVE|nr:hypothetical protein AVEN_118268-1 [Araneus ventricosus]
MDQGVLESMKLHYRKQLLSKLLFERDDDEGETLAPYLENGDPSNDGGSVTETELNGLLEQISGCGNCEEEDVSSWLDCDSDDAGFQLMSDDDIIVQVRKPNSDDDDGESDEDEVIETSKISTSDAFECFAKGLMWLEQQSDSDSTELMLLKQLQDGAAKRRQSCLRQSELPFKSM